MEEIREKNKSKEVDVLALVLKVLKEWKLLLGFMLVFGIIGTIIALNTPKYYTSEVILAPEMSSGGLGLSDNLADMASSFGIDLGSKASMDAIYPEIYPDIFASTDFCADLFDVPVAVKDDATPRSYKQHLMKDFKIPFWELPRVQLQKWMDKRSAKNKKTGSGENPLILSKNDYMLCTSIKELIICLVDKKTSEITISVTDQDPLTAAIMADTVQTRLQAYITEYRTRKARNDYNYYDKMTKEALKDYNIQADKYGAYSDSHRDPLLASVTTQQDHLEQDMESAFQIYQAMKKMREQAEAKIQERTPAFTVIQSAKMTYKPSSRPKLITLLIYLILGGIFDTLWILFGRDAFKKRKQIKTEEQ